MAYWLLLLLSSTVLASPCPPPDCGDCYTWDPNIEECVWDCVDCQVCEDCNCVKDPNVECDHDTDCGDPNCWDCVDCNCVCDDSGNETDEISYEPDVSDLIGALQGALENIPCIGSAEITFAVSGQLNSKDVCCYESDTSYTECISGSADANMGAELSLDITNTKDFSFDHTWNHVGYIKAKAKLDIGPKVTADANGSVSGNFAGCDCEADTCQSPKYEATGHVGASLGVEADGSGSVEVGTKIGWDWFDRHCRFSVGFTAHGEASVSGEGNGTYRFGECQSNPGWDVGCVKAGKCEVNANIEFTVKETPYDVWSGKKTIWDGWDNGKCGT